VVPRNQLFHLRAARDAYDLAIATHDAALPVRVKAFRLCDNSGDMLTGVGFPSSCHF